MDFDNLGNKLANLTMYDVKQLYTAAKNYALNVSEIEAKVNEATSDDPWGASSTLMQEIAAATNNFQDFNEIMPAIYRNFMEREAREWRQIYKALQLLEYIVKHGSERVVDDARSHLGTIKILRSFHYTDESGKDQGINVRNRAKEIAELLADVERIRGERRKARSNKQKYQGASNSDFIPGSGTGRYGGFGSDSAYSGGGGGSYGGGGGGGGGGESVGGSGSGTRRESYDEYDAGDDEDRRKPTVSQSRTKATATPKPPKKAEKVADLFSFDDDEPAPALAAVSAPSASAGYGSADAFDDFDDFQAAPSTPAASSAKQPANVPAVSSSSGKANVFDFLGDGGASTSAAPRSAFATTTAMSPSVAPLQPQRAPSSSSINTTTTSGSKSTNGNGAAATASGLNFDDLWATSAGKASSAATGANKGKMTMAEMAKQKSSSAVWGVQTPQAKQSDPFDFL